MLAVNRIIHRLSSARGERDQSANTALAAEIASAGDSGAITELVDLLVASDKTIRTDAIKVLGEIAGRKPDLLVAHTSAIGSLLASANGVLRWELLTVLDGVAGVDPDSVRPFEDVVIAALGSDSVIARDRAVSILVKLANGPNYDRLMPVLLDVLRTSPVNQLPTYAEQICRIARGPEIRPVTGIIEHRLATIDGAAKVRRIQKAIRSMRSENCNN